MKVKRNNSIVVVGSVAMDSVKTPHGKVENALGGSATYFSLAGRLFSPIQIVGVIGDDFPEKYLKVLKNRNTDLSGLLKVSGETFRWKGSYENPNEAITHETHLNVFGAFDPDLPKHYRSTEYLFLANIHPELQHKVLSQVSRKALVASDTMNHWIKSNKNELLKIYNKVHIAFLNDGEAKLLSEEHNLIKAIKKIHALGPKWVIVKKGEHGVIAYDGKDFLMLPSFPVEEVVDPTGAGDSFAGAFMGYIAQKGKFDKKTILEALCYGTVVASFVVEDFSVAQTAKLTLQKLKRRHDIYTRIAGILRVR